MSHYNTGFCSCKTCIHHIPVDKKLIDAMLLCGFSQKTKKCYIVAVKDLATYYHLSPTKLIQEQIQAYFLYLVKERHLSGSSTKII
jgi:hypothetical protein